MQLILFEKDKPPYQDDWCFIWFTCRLFQFRWFTDNEEWFIYIHFGKYFWCISSCGYWRGKTDNIRR